MWKPDWKVHFLVLLLWVIEQPSPIAAYDGQVQGRRASTDKSSEQILRSFLQSYFRSKHLADDKTRYTYAFAPLNSTESSSVIVYVTGPAWCGSGGCTAFVLARDHSAYKVITKITIVRPPIRVLSSSTNGWRDIGVWVQGGGQSGYEARLSFNGKTYPTNPSRPPAQRSNGKAAGEVLIQASEGHLLYP